MDADCFPNEKTIRRAFRDWKSLKALGENPLAQWDSVQARCQAAGYHANGLSRGLALQELIKDAVEALRPAQGQPDPHDRRWRPYLILTGQFLQGGSPELVRAQLCISKGTYFGEQKRALEMLAGVLQQHEEEAGQAKLHPEPGQAPGAPFMAPPRPSHRVVGRAAVLEQVKARLLQRDAPALTVLTGLPGVGKTALAIELAYDPQVQAQFPDGILWAGLGRQPDTLALLGAWGDAVGIGADHLASRASLPERAALVRARIGLRHMLLIVDDAWQVEPALALQVGGPNCAFLVTTRLMEVALDLAPGQVTGLQELAPDEGLRLLAEVAPRAVEADPEQARRLVQAAGSLPLALLLMGKYLQKRSYHSQARRMQEALRSLQTAEARFHINGPRGPLEAHPNLPFGASLSLRAAIEVSDAALDPAAHAALLDLAVFPPKPSTFSEAAALAVTAAPPAVLDELVDHGLVESVEPDRYTLHQTIADYAALAGGEPAARPAAGRLVDMAAGLLSGQGQDFNLLDRELTNLSAACKLAVLLGPPERFLRLALDLYPYLETRGLYAWADLLLERAGAAAADLGDPALQAEVLERLGDFEVRRGRFGQARRYLEDSIALARRIGAERIEASSQFQLGLARSYMGEVAGSQAEWERGLALSRSLGLLEEEAYFLNALGFGCEEQGRYLESRTLLEKALAKSQACRSQRVEGWTHHNLSMVYLPLGELDRARRHIESCLDCYQRLGDSRGLGWALYQRGRVLRQTGAFEPARTAFEQAFQRLSELDDRMGQGFALHNQGLIEMDLGHSQAAEAIFERAMGYFEPIGCVAGESQVHYHIGVLRRREGNYAAARPLFERALEIRRAIHFAWGEIKAQANLGLVRFHLSDPAGGLAQVREALSKAQALEAPANQAYVETLLARLLETSGRAQEAGEHYRQARALYCRLGQAHLAVEPAAGLARLALAQGDLPTAQALADEIGPASPYPGTDEPARIAHTCQQVAAKKNHE